MTELVRDFLEPADFYKAVKEIGIDFYTGVPDSLLKGMFFELYENFDNRQYGFGRQDIHI